MASSTAVTGPSIERSVTLHFVGDWGQANFHRICSWLSQQFCDRAGPRSRTAIWSIRGGGMEGLQQVQDGEVDLCIVTPAKLMQAALVGEGIFAKTGAMPNLRTLAVLPQSDRMMLAIDPKFGINSFEDLRTVKPALTIATSVDDGTNFIGHVAMRLMEAHGIEEDTLRSWGGSYELSQRPDQAIEKMRLGKADAVLQEAIMTPWWRDLMENQGLTPISMEPEAVARLSDNFGFELASIRPGYWSTQPQEIVAAEFSDFLIVVRDDMPDDIARLLTWCLVETRGEIEVQYAHIPPERSPLTYPLDPTAMAKPSIPLHPAAEKFYMESGYIPCYKKPDQIT